MVTMSSMRARSNARPKFANHTADMRPFESHSCSCMWFQDVRTSKVIAAEKYGSNGLTMDFSARADTGVDPSFSFRVKAGSTVIPFVHTAKGGTWEGEPFAL